MVCVHLTLPLKSTPKSEGYLNRSFPGVKKGGGEKGRSGGRLNRAWRGKRGENEGKRVGGKGPESTLEKLWFWYPSDLGVLFSQESAKGAGGKGARVINCHNFFFTPDRETRRIDHTTTVGTAERKMRQFATPAPFTPAPFRPFWFSGLPVCPCDLATTGKIRCLHLCFGLVPSPRAASPLICLLLSWVFFGKRLAPYRIGKHSNAQNRAKIDQKYTKNMIFCIFGVFLPYFACGAVVIFCRGPSFISTVCILGAL